MIVVNRVGDSGKIYNNARLLEEMLVEELSKKRKYKIRSFLLFSPSWYIRPKKYVKKLGIAAGLVFKPAQLHAGLLSWFELVCIQITA
jgi:hypothetical protein